MKKISRKDLEGLRRQFPVLTKEDMRHYVGGYGNGYSGGGFGNDWFYHGFGGYDPDGNFHWYSGYTQDELDNWEGYWPGGWVYGLGYVAPDTNIYGGNGYGYGWGNDDSYWGDYDTYGGYGEDGGGKKRGAYLKGDWACMFNCMNYIDPTLSAQEYYELFTRVSNIDAAQSGGIPSEYRGKALEIAGFTFEEVNTVFYEGGGGILQLVIFYADDLQGRTHAGILTGKDEQGYPMIHDPSRQGSYPINFDRIATVYRVKKKR